MNKKYAEPLLIMAAISALATMLLSGLATLLIFFTFRGSGPGEPLDDYVSLHFPIFSVALPVLGMVLLALSVPALLGSHPLHVQLRDWLIEPAEPAEAQTVERPKTA